MQTYNSYLDWFGPVQIGISRTPSRTPNLQPKQGKLNLRKKCGRDTTRKAHLQEAAAGENNGVVWQGGVGDDEVLLRRLQRLDQRVVWVVQDLPTRIKKR